ncbi:hypothetical protein A3B21_05060 [Candidatus Uhrbacteria bacterium RIFCSPLOWO2_01_FULL_47_24]|uniref:Uncharacterized protein n=1 Tax=Candidatus Uhrbacteria bacterium RIFCSPLOWO2_01_FULL_47_24 TaxID=1802401 RepID=A0A1F7UUX3_9BACT|nr:MAG: hypothetical protein A2753_03095 [Candidatus Uhrbacteria bacterium RIFCSPHIGHO2_01_FULL_47_11]OGL69321.1 MAG: hypothetical protein A3D58_03450 [Candidatus Uhrbacteria bacterium RIFCSPHIGHO2_02_FULL_46_47]OGL76391.1 MAG: hypothetical protein A3F52_00740 [Candidatus Uhrbacteria bacterium RIFCSPHIGHO2_12_FULL_47_11]OGL82056.1 MAG: hypothetical protein A3B21_05060 [Candidatus Uhrbacteria bacterium RIFCSPLOWO2_01_FULL_47_24]OGL85450.1 MAG: hypothetical protein A3J03_05225 [Candidatus Uhrbact
MHVIVQVAVDAFPLQHKQVQQNALIIATISLAVQVLVLLLELVVVYKQAIVFPPLQVLFALPDLLITRRVVHLQHCKLNVHLAAQAEAVLMMVIVQVRVNA